MKIHANKRGIRALGVAESFRPGDRSSILAGVVMRADLLVDGFSFARSTVEGDDATSSILRMHRSTGRDDVNLILLSGCVLSLYNIVDVDLIHSTLGLPTICLTYRESPGIASAIKHHFSSEDRQRGQPAVDSKAVIDRKIEAYARLGSRKRILLHTGHRVFVRLAGVDEKNAALLLNSFTLQGGTPEPVRLARMLAHAARREGKLLQAGAK